MISYEDLNRFANLMRGHGWRFALTMAAAPHWYTLREQWEHDQAFDWAVNIIRDGGYKEKFGRSTFTRLNVNGFKYWTMGAAVDKTILINRAVVDYSTEFDAYASAYDTMFQDEDSRKENADVMERLGAVKSQRVLDIGSGTGLLIDCRPGEIDPENYVGIEPSRSMFAEFTRKHPHYAAQVEHVTFEDFAHGKFDLIVGMFGSPSYIDPAYLGRVKSMLNSKGRYFLMFYLPGYVPVSSIKAGVEANFFERSHEILNGNARQLGNFIVCEGGR